MADDGVADRCERKTRIRGVTVREIEHNPESRSLKSSLSIGSNARNVFLEPRGEAMNMPTILVACYTCGALVMQEHAPEVPHIKVFSRSFPVCARCAEKLSAK